MAENLAVVNQLLVVGAVLFCIGIMGMLVRRDLIIVLISSQLVLQGLCLSLAALIRLHHLAQGTAWLLLLLGFAVIEAVWGIALAAALRYREGTLDLSYLRFLGETEFHSATDSHHK